MLTTGLCGKRSRVTARFLAHSAARFSQFNQPSRGDGAVAAITIDLRVLGFTLLITLVTGLLFGFLPALRFSRTDLNVSLKEGGRGGGIHGRGLRNALMVSEVALAIVLLVGAGLLIRSFAQLVDVDPGYRAENLLTARIALPPRYRDDAQRAQFYERILQ